jgi:hypothetical protein
MCYESGRVRRRLGRPIRVLMDLKTLVGYRDSFLTLACAVERIREEGFVCY